MHALLVVYVLGYEKCIKKFSGMKLGSTTLYGYLKKKTFYQKMCSKL